MSICIPREEMNKLKEAFKKGEVSIAELYKMKDAERNAVFSKYLGKEYGKEVNSNFEQAMLSKQKQAFQKFVDKTFGKSDTDIRSQMMKRLDKIDKVMDTEMVDDFLGDLASKKLGLEEVSQAEVETMLKLKNEFEEKLAKVKPDSPIGSKDRLEYGIALENFKQYVGNLKERTVPLTAKEIAVQKLFSPGEVLVDLGNIFKAAKGSLDDSFFGRQGIQALLNPISGGTKIWFKNFLKSFSDIGKQIIAKSEEKGLKGLFSKPDDAVMQMIRADINSRPNAINGKYQAATNGYGLGVKGEEAYPSALIERIPGVGRLFKASEVAFNGGALRMRADLADAVIKKAEKNKVDTLDKNEVNGLGELVSSMTGRGEVSLAPKGAFSAKTINSLLFSIKFLKSNVDKLLAPSKYLLAKGRGERVGIFAKKQAALNTLEMVGTIASILTIAEMLHPGSTTLDPSDKKFGKITIGKHSYDITGGMASLAVLASRLVPVEKNGKYGFYYNGKWTEMGKTQFGYNTPMDVFVNFIEGKASPLAGAARDILIGKDFQGRVPTPSTIAENLIVPLPIQNFNQLKDPTSADSLAAIIADGLGIGVTTPKPKKVK